MTPGSKVQDSENGGCLQSIILLYPLSVQAEQTISCDSQSSGVWTQSLAFFFCSPHSAIHMLYFSRVLVFPLSQKLTSICGCLAFPHHSESIHFQIRKSSGIPSSTCSGLPFLIPPVVMLSKGNGTAHAPSILLRLSLTRLWAIYHAKSQP